MHEVFKIKSSKTNPKFQQYLINFEKPQIFKKNLKTEVSKTWMHVMQENRSLPCEERLVKSLKIPREEDWNEWERLGRWKVRGIEREIDRNELQIAWGEYIDH